jgi:hypothetical protein
LHVPHLYITNGPPWHLSLSFHIYINYGTSPQKDMHRNSETPKRHREHSDGTPPKRTKVATDPAAEPQAPIPTGSGEVKSQECEHDPPEPLTEMEE